MPSFSSYACDDTPELMPLPIFLAHRLAERLTAVRKGGELPYLRPDGKTQVTIAYDGDRAVSLDAVVVSSQPRTSRSRACSSPTSASTSSPRCSPSCATPAPRCAPTTTAPTSTPRASSSSVARWATPGSPAARSSSTPTAAWPGTVAARSRARTPRRSTVSAAYATRWVAKNVVAAGLARRCEVQVAYAIGKAQPVGLYVETFGTETVPAEKIQAAILSVFDLRPAAILDDLDFLRPIYKATATPTPSPISVPPMLLEPETSKNWRRPSTRTWPGTCPAPRGWPATSRDGAYVLSLMPRGAADRFPNSWVLAECLALLGGSVPVAAGGSALFRN